ncbi:MAG: energy transducer TonB [Bacteroidia bacterium]
MKKFVCLYSIMLAFSVAAIGQDSLGNTTDTVKIQEPVIPIEYKDPGTDTSRLFVVVETMPEFPGGVQAMQEYISKNLKYPLRARWNSIQGKVQVEFVVTTTGNITDVRVVNKADPLLAKAAIKVVKSMPNWSPGIVRGQPVPVRFVMPITFKLEE